MNWQSTPQPSNGQHRLTLLEILGAPQAILADLGTVKDFIRERRQKADCSVIWEDVLICSIRITECGALGLSLIHPPTSQPNLLALTETCAGLGALGLGAQYAGWQVVAQNDINEKFTEHQTRYGKIPVVTGDIADMKTVSALHHAHSTSGTIAFGFSLTHDQTVFQPDCMHHICCTSQRNHNMWVRHRCSHFQACACMSGLSYADDTLVDRIW